MIARRNCWQHREKGQRHKKKRAEGLERGCVFKRLKASRWGGGGGGESQGRLSVGGGKHSNILKPY